MALRAVFVVACLCLSLTARGAKHSFTAGDKVTLWANKVGPFSSPSETYQYYDLPFCQPENKDNKLLTLGEVVDGNRMVATPYDLSFRVDKDKATLCSRHLGVEDIKAFRTALAKDYYFQFFYDDLPIWGYVGKVETIKDADSKDTKKLFLFTHIHFDIAYNEDRIIEINVSTDPTQVADLSEGGAEEQDVTFTYSVTWKSSLLSFDKRMDKYRKYQFLKQHLEIHWFSIINSCVTVLLLTGFLATILMRVLKNDFVKYSRDDEDPDDAEESGWKFVHGDVFRFPPARSLFCALVGTGTQLLVLSFCVFGLALVGAFYPYNRGAMFTALIILYALTAGISGYTSASYYRQMEGTKWVGNLLLTSSIFCGPLFAIFCVNNTVAIAYGSTAALPFGTIVIILLLWALVTVPLTIVGGVLGKNTRTEFAAPCRTNKYPREIPELPWYRSVMPQMVMAGFLPFSAIYIELYYIFASVWGHKVYTIYSILFIVFCILCVVTAFITVALTYFQLAAEDHRWWWRSFLAGGSTGIFVYAYCFYYYLARSDMNGLMQATFYFGYNLMVCLGFFLLLGYIGWRSSLLFVRRIYRAIKCE
ncbi:Putative phagocytic receptor 1b [Auxenochlorella protothecoides]|uniref:Transmembrane 9 superfamily member n=1 Tax=Auxenochlorella protothecoides TaxID=3075 RepID=A0A087SM09_AUXPR|nr:Putative phagocytic receptor 1b [Auxenochlorella protothecoides]KFM26763.1 Putative phagocytic receptor 1b [Auxenochlorella protothecoides]